ncbi:MAG TPA: DNA polymerase IV [Actinomycetota bacterium]|nr:DNA polymerase IV [Actinomycetota bacterium]
MSSVLHVDLDEFIAAVEILRRPELAGRPVVVGGRGDPSTRGAVATASYAARRFGIHSGMALRIAARRCPDAVFLPADRDAYDEASQRVMKVLERFADVLEVWGWDEAFLQVEGDAEAVARAVQEAVWQETGLACSIGIGDNKLRAKLASAFAKPAGVYRLTGREWWSVMGDRPTRDLWGIGSKTARRLADLGIRTVRELAESDADQVSAAFGPRTGPWLVALAHGEYDSPVSSAPRTPRSRSFERTFDEDVDDPAIVAAEVQRMARELCGHVAAADRLVSGVAVKIRFAPFFTRARSRRLSEPSVDAEAVAAAAATALARFELDRPVRLVGVRVDLA